MNHPCVKALDFPAVIDNRPSLAHVAYRIGRYSDFRAALMSALDRSPLLRQWSYRGSDDVGIALLEGAAILGDILTFYQELYANQAWLGTATWPQSIAALVRLIGYRPAPGLGGVGVVSFEISGNSSVVVPAGFPFSAQIAGMSAPANFETADSLLALPGLSRLSLYAPSLVPGIAANASELAADAQDLAVAGVTLKKNDRLMLVDEGNTANRQIAVITNVATVLDQTVISIAGAWQGGTPVGSMSAYKLGRTFRAFGYNAPATQITLNGTTPQSTAVNTALTEASILQGFPLERQVNDLSAGITMLVDLQVTQLSPHAFIHTNFFEPRTALSVKSDTDSVGPLQGGITRVGFEPSGLTSSPGLKLTDRRTAICHEVIGQGFAIAGVRQVDSSALPGELGCLSDGATYESLDGRLLQFVALNPDDTAARVEGAQASIDRSKIGDPSAIAVRNLSLTPALTQFSLSDFPLSNPTIAVFGNVVPMTQGKTQATAVLGNGDARQIFQSFQLPKAPLTWLLDEALTPPREPQLSIVVNQIEWTEVDSLFASGPLDKVYILREDDAGNTWVQFGNGINGATLPSGVNNVTATYRTGNAANGWRQSGTTPQANARVANLSQLRLYDEVTRGTADEDAAHIQQTAPGRVQELGRIVSLSDFEFEALAISGVEKALAVWDTNENIPVLTVTVLMSDDTPQQLSSVQALLSQANVLRGPNRFPVLVLDASLEYVYVAITVGIVAGYQAAPVQAAITAALGVLPSDGSAAPEAGLFSVDARQLGEPEYASRIEATVQNVDGVAWVEVTALGPLGTATDPSTLGLPNPATLTPAISCAGNRVLALFAQHFIPSLGDA